MRSIVHDLIAAGVEGGSKRAILEEWGLDDVAAQQAAWKRNGPPVNIALVAIAASLGVKLLNEEPDKTVEKLDVQPGTPTLADLSAEASLPNAGADTLAASRAIVERLKAGT